MMRILQRRSHMTVILVEDWVSHGADILMVGGWSHQLVTAREFPRREGGWVTLLSMQGT